MQNTFVRLSSQNLPKPAHSGSSSNHAATSARFLALIDEKTGDMKAGISDMRLFDGPLMRQHLTRAPSKSSQQCSTRGRLCVADLNASEEVLVELVKACDASGVRLWLDPTSATSLQDREHNQKGTLQPHP